MFIESFVTGDKMVDEPGAGRGGEKNTGVMLKMALAHVR